LNAPVTIEVRVDGARLGRFTIGGGAAEPPDDADGVLQVRAQVTAGLHQALATIVKSEDIRAEGLGPARIPIWNREGDVPSAELSISSLLIDGPYNGRLPKNSPSRRRIFVCLPGAPAGELAGLRAKAERSCQPWRGVRIAARSPTTMSRR
jgi:hypothetical protein